MIFIRVHSSYSWLDYPDAIPVRHAMRDWSAACQQVHDIVSRRYWHLSTIGEPTGEQGASPSGQVSAYSFSERRTIMHQGLIPDLRFGMTFIALVEKKVLGVTLTGHTSASSARMARYARASWKCHCGPILKTRYDRV